LENETANQERVGIHQQQAKRHPQQNIVFFDQEKQAILYCKKRKVGKTVLLQLL
jgi:hypothetical protein